MHCAVSLTRCGRLTNGQSKWEHHAELSQCGSGHGKPLKTAARSIIRGRRERWYLLISGRGSVRATFPDKNWVVTIGRGARVIVMTEDGVILFRAVLVFALSITSWLHSRSISLPAQIITPLAQTF